MNDPLSALETSAARLGAIVDSLGAEQLTNRAYPTKWTIADVLSHLGSGATIMRSSLATQLTGVPIPDGYQQSVWDEWNAKQPAAQSADALIADRELLDSLAAVTDEERAAFRVEMGPMSIDFDVFVGLRLNEHALHTWDIEVVLDPSATVPVESAAVVIDNLEVVGRFGGQPDGKERSISVHTVDPSREFTITSTPEAVSLVPSSTGAGTQVELPAESFVRLVYGRLDRDHTPEGYESPEVESLRAIFPGL